MDPIIAILIVFLLLFVVYWLAGKFTSGVPHQVIGVVLAIVFVVYALNRLGVGIHL